MVKDCKRFGVNVAARWTLALLSGTLLVVPHALRAQTATQGTAQHQKPLPKPGTPIGAEQPKFKGIWEPVNYNQDMQLTDVFFVTPDVGYVSGAGGTIFKTVDGGRKWTPQLGGDPQSQEPEINHLRFLDQSHGWAVQAGDPAKLLRTVDGENWEQVGALPRGWGLLGYQFVSPSVGVLLDGNNNVSHIFRTLDGGRNWKEVFPPDACKFNAQVEGLNRQLSCTLWTLNMVSRTVGYILGRVDYQKPEVLVVAKTIDGGVSWSITPVQGPGAMFDYNGSQWMSAFFTDENSGVLATGGDRLYSTSDGGQSWRGLTGTAPGPVQFADPEVGWSFYVNKFSYTTDGGKHWSSRGVSFPARPYAFNLPRRDRAYVVGEHGMIYRYRVVPATYQAVAHSIDAPAMPGIDSPVFGEVATLNDVVGKLHAKLPAPTGGLQQSSGIAGSSSTGIPGASGFQQDTGSGPVAGGYMDSCCGPLMQQLETTATSFATNVPAFSQRFRNLNLFIQGFNFLNNAVNQANTLKQSIRALRQARDSQSASLALTTVQSQIGGISSSGGFVQDTTAPPQD